MKTFALARAVTVLAMLLAYAPPAAAQGPVTAIDVRGADGTEVWVAPGEDVVLRWTWATCARGMARSFVGAVNENGYMLDGEPIFDSFGETRAYWGDPERLGASLESCPPAADGDWEVAWEYDLGPLAAGDHILHSSAGVSHLVTNGMDSDHDGKPDQFDGRLFETEIVIHVIVGGALVPAAQQEGGLTVIALPGDWCNYGVVMDRFSSTYGIPINSVNPGGSSEDELQAIRDGIESPTADTPDVIDVGPGFALQAKEEGLIAPFQVATWDSIPQAIKDGDGFWYGDYYGVMAIAVNASGTVTPSTWEDLIAGEGVAATALGGNPLVSNMGFFAVYSAALANGGSPDDIGPGLAFFHDLNEAGRLSSQIGNGDTLISGETPVLLEWTYLALAQRDANPGSPIEVVVPPEAQVAGIYAQAVSAYAPHPNAARLWMEYVYSDEGQLGWLEGYCFPARYEDLLDRDVIPQDLLDRLPDIGGAIFPSVEQIADATAFVEEHWVCTVYGCP